MAFLEDLGRKITDAGQGVAQQTKNFAEVTRLGGVVAEKERELAGLFAALGQLYFDSHSGDEEPEGAEYFGRIQAVKAELESAKEEVRRLKGLGKCPACGADVARGVAFCSACGAAIPAAEAAPAGRVCPGCGRAVPEGNKFCTGCGTKMD